MQRYVVEEIWCKTINKKVYFEFYTIMENGEYKTVPHCMESCDKCTMHNRNPKCPTCGRPFFS